MFSVQAEWSGRSGGGLEEANVILRDAIMIIHIHIGLTIADE